MLVPNVPLGVARLPASIRFEMEDVFGGFSENLGHAPTDHDLRFSSRFSAHP
jgi:hypothetical protein